MLIAVTGATGFLGRYVAARLAAAGHRQRCWHRPGSDRGGFGPAAKAVEWLPGRLGDPGDAAALVRGADALVHGALFRPGGAGYLASAKAGFEEFLQANLMGSLQLFEAAFTAGVSRCVFISTCAVHDVILDDRPLDETHPLLPMSDYGAHKAALEAFVHSYGFGRKWPVCALRPTGIYGLAHPPQDSKWYDLVGGVIRGESVASPKGGKEVHAADVARAVELLLNADAAAIRGQAFNCYDRYVADQDVARIAKELTGSPSKVADLNRGPKHQIDTGKLRSLGMTFGGEELLRRTVGELVEAHRGGRASGGV
jgi:nucleoside-diphosphate-sugar epimerase